MLEDMQNFDSHTKKTNPGLSFTRSQRNLKFSNQNSTLGLSCNENMDYHFASNTQKVYSAFQHGYYLPPHLKSSKVDGLVFKGQCQAWKIKHLNDKNSNKYNNRENKNGKNQQKIDRNKWNYTTNYDTQYRIYQTKQRALPVKKYHCLSGIKYLIDQDRPRKPNKLAQSHSQNGDNLTGSVVNI